MEQAITDAEKDKQRVEKRLNKEPLRWERWKSECYKNGIPDISKANSDIILQYVKDMERGQNINHKSPKGSRSPRRLNDVKDKLIIFANIFEELYNVRDLTQLNEEQIFNFFSGMQNGEFKTKKGKKYKSIDTFVRHFKAFWNWHITSSRKVNKVVIENITQDLGLSGDKPDWVYLTEIQVRKLADSMGFDYKVLIMFLYDTGIRAPLELCHLKVSDVCNECKELNIRICKKGSFPRKIKLMFCSDLLKTYIQVNKKNPDDYLFPVCPEVVNRNLKKSAVKLFGDLVTLAGHKYSQITMYDFRHCACCYWLPRYPTESALKYRFGWKKTERIHYYSELLGMKDTITEGDLLIDVTKTELENRVKKVEHENGLLKDKVSGFEKYMKIIDELSKRIERLMPYSVSYSEMQ